MPPKTPKTPKAEDSLSQGECLQMMERMFENMTKLIKDMLEKHMEAYQAEISSLKKELDIEKKRRKKMEEEAAELRSECKSVNASLTYVFEKLNGLDQEKLNCDIVLDNVDATEEVRDASGFVCELVNKTLMGTIIEKNDIKMTKVIKNKYKKDKITVITTLSSVANKKAILSQKKLFKPKNIYVKENLTPLRYRLFKETRLFAKEKDYKFTWTKDGCVYLRKNENSSVVHVRCSSDLVDLAHPYFE